MRKDNRNYYRLSDGCVVGEELLLDQNEYKQHLAQEIAEVRRCLEEQLEDL